VSASTRPGDRRQRRRAIEALEARAPPPRQCGDSG